jgi:hypothetical protein
MVFNCVNTRIWNVLGHEKPVTGSVSGSRQPKNIEGEYWTGLHSSRGEIYTFYVPERRPILCTLHGAVDFLKFLKIAVVGGWGVLLGHSAYIISLYMMEGVKYWDVMYTLRPSTSLQMPYIELHRPGIEPSPPLIECGRSTIELWNLYIIWVC